MKTKVIDNEEYVKLSDVDDEILKEVCKTVEKYKKETHAKEIIIAELRAKIHVLNGKIDGLKELFALLAR